MRGAGSRLRGTEVLLLLALRTGRRSVEEEGRLCRPRRFGQGPIGTAAADGSLPPEGGAGVRSTPGEDRGPDRGAYLHLEVRFIAGMVPIRAPLGPGNLYPLPALRHRVRLEGRPFGGFARGRRPGRDPLPRPSRPLVPGRGERLGPRVSTRPLPRPDRRHRGPLIPEREEDLVRLIEWAGAEGLAFVNLNEMEFSEANFPRMKVHGYEMKHELSYGVKGADPVALRSLERRWKTTVHYCTSGYKDGWQLRSRSKRRAENVARPWDVVTEDGTLVKGILEGSDLERLMRDLEVRHWVPKDLMGLDDARKRLEVAPWILQEIAPILGRPAFLVEEYPTADGLEVERTRLA